MVLHSECILRQAAVIKTALGSMADNETIFRLGFITHIALMQYNKLVKS